MYKFFALTLFIAAASANASIRQISPNGIVEGVRSCGSQGTILQIRVIGEPDCTRTPCVVKPGNDYRFEIDWSPSKNHQGLRLRVTIIQGSNSEEFMNAIIPDSAVELGQTYQLTQVIRVDGRFPGFADLKIELIGRDDGTLELCGLAEMDTQVTASIKRLY